MRTVLCVLLMTITSFVAHAQQQPPLLGPPTIAQEERRGDIVCTVYRQFGTPDTVTISMPGNVDLNKQDIAGCVRVAKQRMSEPENGTKQQKLKKNS